MQRAIVWTLATLLSTGCAAGAQVINEDAKLTAPDGSAVDQFGFSVSVDSDTAVIGAWRDDDNGRDSGSAYVLVRDEKGVWSQQAKLIASDGNNFDLFAHSVSIEGDTAIIGAYQDDDNGSESGSAFVFVRDDNGDWSQQAKLLASDGDSDDWFGYSVAISGDTAIVGAHRNADRGGDSGSAYVFVRDGNGAWTQQAKLLPTQGAAGDEFGVSVAIDGDTALVGAQSDNETGSAVVFVRDAKGVWAERATLLASDGIEGVTFGNAVSINGDTAVIGAVWDDTNGLDAGAAYVFTRDREGAWTQRAKLLAADGAAVDQFGYAVSLDGDTAVIGARFDDDNGVGSGSAYVFTHDGEGVWTQRTKLLPADGDLNDYFGASVAVNGDTAIAGAWRDTDNGDRSGSAYVFGLTGVDDCSADWDGNGLVNAADVGAFLSTYFDDLANGTLNADFDDNGVVNPADVGAFLSAYFGAIGTCP